MVLVSRPKISVQGFRKVHVTNLVISTLPRLTLKSKAVTFKTAWAFKRAFGLKVSLFL
jgi:hypothetical protein